MKKGIIAGVVLLFLTFYGNAHADLISYSAGLNGQSLDSYPGTKMLQSNGSIALQQFIPSMGTLNSITLDLSAIFNYGTQFENKSPNSGSTVTKTIDQRLTIGSTLLDTGNANYSRNWTVGKYDGLVDYAGTSGFTVSDTNGATNVHLTFTGADMASYIGTGTLPLAVSSYADFSGGFTGGNGSFINTQNFNTAATVTYDYTPTPIPAAAWMFGSGLVGLVGIRRRLAK